MAETKPDDIDARRMSLGEHLEELRGHVFRAVGWLTLSFIICFVFQKPLMVWATWPHTKTMRDLEEEDPASLQQQGRAS